MKSIKDGLLAVVLSAFVLVLSGCGNGDRPELGLVTGTVTLDNEPVSGIAVVFAPDNGRPARGKTDADGKYELTYIGKTRGCKIGPNSVQIAPNEEGEEDDEDEVDAKNTENVGAAKRSKRRSVKIPARYNSKSELKADVEPGENVFDFKLESQKSE